MMCFQLGSAPYEASNIDEHEFADLSIENLINIYFLTFIALCPGNKIIKRHYHCSVLSKLNTNVNMLSYSWTNNSVISYSLILDHYNNPS